MEIFRAGKTIEKSAWSPLGFKNFRAGKRKSAWSPFLARRVSFSCAQGFLLLPAGFPFRARRAHVSCPQGLILLPFSARISFSCPQGPCFLPARCLFFSAELSFLANGIPQKEIFFWKSCGQDKK